MAPLEGRFIPLDSIEVVQARVQHHKDVDIPAWANGTGDWFSCRLFELMAHCDHSNFGKLAIVFPDHAEAFTWWKEGGTA